jgi:hypothetical protein
LWCTLFHDVGKASHKNATTQRLASTAAWRTAWCSSAKKSSSDLDIVTLIDIWKMKPAFLVMLASISSFVFAASEVSSRKSQELPDSSPEKETAIFDIEDAHIAQDSLHMGVMPSHVAQASPRYRQEKAHLTKRMNRKSGKWGTSHPRYRLLEALWGYSRYRERNMAELDRWRTLYKSVGKKQKKVSDPKCNSTCAIADHDADFGKGGRVWKEAR